MHSYDARKAEDMNVHPTEIARLDDGQLLIAWSDGQRLVYTARQLRDSCPCATCREKRNQEKPLLPVLSEAETLPLGISGMKPVGHYAYSVEFSDGHDTGIFTFDLLRELGRLERA